MFIYQRVSTGFTPMLSDFEMALWTTSNLEDRPLVPG